MKKLDYIDALRGMAILGVIMLHTNHYGSLNLEGLSGDILRQGGRGVQLFFIASAFTLFLSFKNRRGNEAFPIRNFFLRRFFRIAPMYYIGICYYLLQDGLGARYTLGNETHVTPLNIISNITFLHGFNPNWIDSIVPGGWSIGVEMMFYAVLPFLFSKIKNINQAFNFFLLSLVVRIALQVLIQKIPISGFERLLNDYLFLYFPSQLPIFAIGILMYFFICENDNSIKISPKSLLTLTVLILIQLATGIPFIFQNHILFGIAFLILGISLSKYKFLLIVNPVISYIGKISFSMYLVHFAILHWLTRFGFIDYFNNGILNYVAKLSVVLLLTVIISSFFYRIVEVPFQKLGKHIIERLEKKADKQINLQA